jgi:hypothetical protein
MTAKLYKYPAIFAIDYYVYSILHGQTRKSPFRMGNYKGEFYHWQTYKFNLQQNHHVIWQNHDITIFMVKITLYYPHSDKWARPTLIQPPQRGL